MGRRKQPIPTRSHTLPSSPTHSLSSSSDFEFTVSSLSPKKSSAADELFYKGQLLPLHLSPRLSMVRTLLASSSASSSSTYAASRDSTTSSNDDSRSSFSTDPELCDEYKRLTSPTHNNTYVHSQIITSTTKKTNYFSLSRFSSLFRKETTTSDQLDSGSSLKKMSTTIRKYLKKAKPLYQKLSQNQTPIINPNKTDKSNLCMKAKGSMKCNDNITTLIGRKENVSATITHSFSGNLRYPRRKNNIVTSCPSSIKSSPSHSRNLGKNNKNVGCNSFQDSSSMEELQSAIQGAIAHCKNSLVQEK